MPIMHLLSVSLVLLAMMPFIRIAGRGLLLGSVVAALLLMVPPAGADASNTLLLTAPDDTSMVRIVQPGAPGEATRVLQEGASATVAHARSGAVRIVQPGAPGEPTRVLSSGAIAPGQPARIVYPGAPGEPSRVHRTGETMRQAGPTYSEADVVFMRDMILHHVQAVQMTELAMDRAASNEVRRLAERIERSQEDEITYMLAWLERRDQEQPTLPPEVRALLGVDDDEDHEHHEHDAAHDHDAHDEHAHHHTHDHSDMPGMLSPDQLDELAAASGEDFDRLFLEFMIFHHEGAIHMVNELFAAPNAGQETEMFAFASHVEADQVVEIERMERLLQQLP